MWWPFWKRRFSWKYTTQQMCLKSVMKGPVYTEYVLYSFFCVATGWCGTKVASKLDNIALGTIVVPKCYSTESVPSAQHNQWACEGDEYCLKSAMFSSHLQIDTYSEFEFKWNVFQHSYYSSTRQYNNLVLGVLYHRYSMFTLLCCSLMYLLLLLYRFSTIFTQLINYIYCSWYLWMMNTFFGLLFYAIISRQELEIRQEVLDWSAYHTAISATTAPHLRLNISIAIHPSLLKLKIWNLWGKKYFFPA